MKHEKKMRFEFFLFKKANIKEGKNVQQHTHTYTNSIKKNAALGKYLNYNWISCARSD